MARTLSSLFFVLGFAYLGLTTLLALVEGRWSDMIPVNQYLIGGAILSLIFSFRVRDFYYDDRYEIFTIRNPRVLLPALERQVKVNLELPKKQIMDYRVTDYWIYKKLTIYFASYRGEFKMKHFHVYAMPKKTWLAILTNLNILVERNNPKDPQGGDTQ